MKQILFVSLLVFILSNNLRTLASYNWANVYNELVARHNTLRAKHKAPALGKVAQLATLSQTVANHCVQKGTLDHVKQTFNGKPVGQNLYVSGTSGSNGPTGTVIANSWYEEIKNYDFKGGKSKNGGVVGHFTQLVWKGSQYIGCALAIGKFKGLNGFYVCCDYYPAGNYVGQYTQNVFP